MLMFLGIIHLKCNILLTNNVVSLKQLGSDVYQMSKWLSDIVENCLKNAKEFIIVVKERLDVYEVKLPFVDSTWAL